MDKEQAIEIIETHSDYISSSSLLGQALNMAIDALKAQLSNEGTTSDMIDRQAVIDMLNVGAELLRRALDLTDVVGDERVKYEMELDMIEAYIDDIKKLPTVQPEPAIPLSWIDEHIERLKGMDNAFATLSAMQISGMVKKWRDEQDETD